MNQQNNLLSLIQSKEISVDLDFRKYVHKNQNIYARDEYARTILMFAAKNSHNSIFEYIINNYPKLITCTDSQDMNVMHYIASSIEKNKWMIEYITNKKFIYNKLIWNRNKNGLLPKDLAKQCKNKNILKIIDKIMNDTWDEYHHIARINNKNINNKKQIMDQDPDVDDDTNDHDQDDDLKMINKSISNRITSCFNRNKNRNSRRKRKHEQLTCDNDIIMNDLNSLLIKRRRLNNSGSFIRTSPQHPEMSPSPLPPLPPSSSSSNDYTTPPLLSLTPNNSPYLLLNDNNNNNINNIDINIPSTYLKRTLSQSQLKAPKLIRRNAVNYSSLSILNDITNDKMMDISSRFYHRESITREQCIFVEWYSNNIGRNQFLPIIIKYGYDNIDKFLKLTKSDIINIFGNKMGNALLLSMKTEMNINHNNNNNNNNNDNIMRRLYGLNNYDMNIFNQRIKDLQIIPNDNDNITSMEDDDDDDDIDINRNILINESVINSSSNNSDNDIYNTIIINTNNCISNQNNGNNNINSIIELSWGDKSSEDDDL